MKVAAIDLGTNSFLCLIVEGDASGISKVVSDEVQITRLGEGVHSSRRLSEAALLRAEACFKDFQAAIRLNGVDRIKAVATSAARDAKNGARLFELGSHYGIPIEVISGDHEARYTFYGATLDVKNPDGVAVVDVGGGSTEFLYSQGASLKGESLDIGSVRLTEMFFKSQSQLPQEIAAARSYIRHTQRALPEMKAHKLIAVAGTPTALACASQNIEFCEARVSGYVLTKKALGDWVSRLSAMSFDERAKLPGVGQKRADVVLAGTLILESALEVFTLDEMVVSTKGLRYGLADAMLKEGV